MKKLIPLWISLSITLVVILIISMNLTTFILYPYVSGTNLFIARFIVANIILTIYRIVARKIITRNIH